MIEGSPAVPLTMAVLRGFKASPVDADYPGNRATFYSPIDRVHEALMAVLRDCRRSIILSMYGLTDVDAAAQVDRLLNHPGIYAQVTLDRSQAAGRTERALLEKYRADLDTNTVAIGTSERGQIIHRKMLIIDGVWTITGSTNWSLNGEQKQDNEMTVTYSTSVAAEARHILDLSHAKALTDMEKRRGQA